MTLEHVAHRLARPNINWFYKNSDTFLVSFPFQSSQQSCLASTHISMKCNHLALHPKQDKNSIDSFNDTSSLPLLDLFKLLQDFFRHITSQELYEQEHYLARSIQLKLGCQANKSLFQSIGNITPMLQNYVNVDAKRTHAIDSMCHPKCMQIFGFLKQVCMQCDKTHQD